MTCATMLKTLSAEPWRSRVRDIFAVLQLFAAIFLSILGLALAFRAADAQSLMVGSFLAGVGLTFVALLFVNVKKPR
jgi:uncharacterized membrane protein